MKKCEWSLLTAAVVLVGAGLASAAARPIADATVSFGFSVAGTQEPAGKYEVLVEDPSLGTLVLKNVETGKTTIVTSTTRLAMREGDQSALVFDKSGDRFYLSEIHISGSDGYFLPGAPGEHTHAQVKVHKKS
jgi:hypothetical protein